MRSHRSVSRRTCFGEMPSGNPVAATACRHRRAAAPRFSLGLGDAFRCRRGILSSGVAPRVQRRQLFPLGQVFFGRLKPARDGSAAAGKLAIQPIAIVFRLLHLQLKHTQLLLAGVELPAVGALEHDLAADRRAAAGESEQRQRPGQRARDRSRHE